MASIIFIIGTGRSGTNLVGRIIGSHPQVIPYIEDSRFFKLATKIAIEQKFRTRRTSKLIRRYQKEAKAISGKSNYVLDKSHTNIWIADQLFEKFGDAKFIGVSRDVYSTVSSMLQHSGVMSWYDTLNNKVENQFLGINNDNVDFFADLPLESKCAFRWISHQHQLGQLQKTLGANLYITDYAEVIKQNEIELERYSNFLGLENKFRVEKLNPDSLTKWKSSLKPQQIDNIEMVVNKYF